MWSLSGASPSSTPGKGSCAATRHPVGRDEILDYMKQHSTLWYFLYNTILSRIIGLSVRKLTACNQSERQYFEKITTSMRYGAEQSSTPIWDTRQ
jgi:hypothetical protein